MSKFNAKIEAREILDEHGLTAVILVTVNEQEMVDRLGMQAQFRQWSRRKESQVMYASRGTDHRQSIPECLPGSGFVGGSVAIGGRAVVWCEAKVSAQDAHWMFTFLCGHSGSPASSSP